MEGDLGRCPFCGGVIDSLGKSPASSSSEPAPAAPPAGNREERMARLMKKYEEAMMRGDHEAAAGFMEEYLRTTVTGMPGFETAEKVDAFVSESMKTFWQNLESTPSETNGPDEAPDPDDETILSKGSSGGTEHSGDHESTGAKPESSSKRGLFDSLKKGLKDVVDVDEIIDDAKDVFGG